MNRNGTQSCFETPFTEFKTNSIVGMFDHSDVVQLAQILRDIEPMFLVMAAARWVSEAHVP